jgi:hypothetical protein
MGCDPGSTEPAGMVHLGEQGKLAEKSTGYVLGFDSEATYTEDASNGIQELVQNFDLKNLKMPASTIAKANHEEQLLVDDGRAAKLTNGTRVLVIKKGGPAWTARLVLITNGKHKNQYWWVIDSEIVPLK